MTGPFASGYMKLRVIPAKANAREPIPHDVGLYANAIVLSVSKGGFTTKIHLRTNAVGLPMAAEITGGEVSDYKGYDLVMQADAPAPKVLLADRGMMAIVSEPISRRAAPCP